MGIKVFSYYKIVARNELSLLFRHLVFNILYTISIILPGLVTGYLFDYLNGTENVNYTFWIIIAILAGVYIERTTFQFLTLLTDGWYRLTIEADLRESILQDLFKKPGAQSLPKEISPGDAISRFRDDISILSFWPKFVNNEISYTIFAFISILILISINITFTLIVIIPLSFVLIITYFARQQIEKYRFNFQKTTGQSTELLGEAFSSIQAIMVANAENSVASYYKKVNDLRRDAAQKDKSYTIILEIVASNAASIGTGFLLLLIVQALPAGTFTIGELALYSYLISWISDYVGYTGNFWSIYEQTEVSLTRVLDIHKNLAKEASNKIDIDYLKKNSLIIPLNTKQNIQPFLSLDINNLSYEYPDSKNGINNITFSFKRKSFTVIAGRTGSGKTTLIKVILGLLEKSNGEIYWNKEKIEKLDQFFVPPQISYLPQVPRLFSDTIKNNILFGITKETADIQNAIYTAVLEEDINKFESGIETKIGPKGVKLSGGQRQRIAAARMFIHKSELLVIDDLSNALDAKTEEKIWNEIQKMPEITCIVVSNKKSVLEMATQVIVLKNGTIDAIGSLEKVLYESKELQLI